MDANCATLVADLFSYCYDRDVVDSLSYDNQADVIEAFISTSRYLDYLSNMIDSPYFEGIFNQIYLPELQLNKAKTRYRSPRFRFRLSIANGSVYSKIYDKRDDFDFDIFHFWMGTFLVVHLMVYTVRNLLGLLESATMLRTSPLLWWFFLFYVLAHRGSTGVFLLLRISDIRRPGILSSGSLLNLCFIMVVIMIFFSVLLVRDSPRRPNN